MARNIKWKVRFKTLKERNAEVLIYKEGWTGSITEIEPAENTFTTEEDTDDDMMRPVRTQSGYLRVIDNGDLKGLMPEDNMSHYVELIIDEVVEWIGYMRAETFSEAWDRTPLEVEFPLISPMEMIDGTYLDQDKGMGLISLGKLLQECFEAAGVNYEKIYFPKNVTFEKEGNLEKSKNLMSVFMVMVSRITFFEENDNLNTLDDGYQRYDGMTRKEFLKEFCGFWGWTIQERGRNLYFIDPNITEMIVMSWEEWKKGIDGKVAIMNDISIDNIEIENLELAGNDNKIECLQGYGKVRIKADVDEVKDVVPAIKIDDFKFEEGFRQIYTGFAGSKQLYEQVMIYAGEDSKDRVEMKIYKSKSNGEWEELTDIYGKDRYGGIGAQLIKYDRFKPEDLSNKRNYNYKEALRVQIKIDNKIGRQPTEEEANKLPVVIMKGQKEVLYSNGAFVISGTTNGIERSYFNNVNDIVPTKETNGKCMLPIILKIGNDYWNGSEWVNEWSKFEIRIGADDDENTKEGTGKIVTTKILKQPYNGADGYVIPINKQLSGEAIIQILLPYTSTSTDILYLDNFKVEYYKDDELTKLESDRNTNSYGTITGKNFKNEKEISLKITTENGNRAAYNTLVSNGKPTGELYFIDTDKMDIAEIHLLGILKQIYGRITEKLRIEVDRGANLGPLMRLTRQGKVYRLLSERIEWADDSEEIMIEDIQ